MRTSVMIGLAVASATLASAAAAKVGDTRAGVISAAQKQFAKIDADKNGKVTAAEMTTFMTARAARSGETVPAQRVQRRMKRIDTDGDGMVTAEEMSNEAGTRFDKSDTNRNGTIDTGEGKQGGGAEN